MPPFFRDVVFQRLISTQVLSRRPNTHCSFCHEIGHTINKCCHEHAILTFVNISLFLGDLMSIYSQTLEFRNRVKVFLERKPLIELKLYVSFFDYAVSFNKRQIIYIIVREIDYIRLTSLYRARTRIPIINVELIHNIIEDREEETCPICLDVLQQDLFISTNCNHKLCVNCACQYITSFSSHVSCPLCRATIHKIFTISVENYNKISHAINEYVEENN